MVTSLSAALAAAALVLAPVPASVMDATPTHDSYTTADTAAGIAVEWTVPEGVTSVTITASGGNGGTSKTERPGGRGATLTVVLAVEPGQVLAFTLGADGTATGPGGIGYGPGGNGINAGGGGGSTAVLLDGVVAIVAGGGGGSATSSSAGGGGAAGTPDGQPGARRGGAGGTAGTGGIGVAPWGGPGGSSYVGSGGTVNGSEAGAGGGAGYGGGGAGGAYGDGGGGGSYSSSPETTTYASRLDTLVDGWVQLDYLLPEPVVEQPAAAPVDQPDIAPTIFGIPRPYVGMAAAAIVVLFIVTLAIVRPRRRT